MFEGVEAEPAGEALRWSLVQSLHRQLRRQSGAEEQFRRQKVKAIVWLPIGMRGAR
jgi:hypothetical protein